MKRSVLTLAVLFLFLVTATYIQAKEAQYVGVKKCKTCHMSKKRGNQYGKWKASLHAKAFETLASEEAKAVAKKAGVEGDPQKSPKCLKCHVTGFDAPASAKAATLTQEEGVSCEACHGPGSLYKSMKVMKALSAGTQDPKAVALEIPSEATCKKCHNEESPTYKPFKFDERVKEIAHPVPK